VVATGANERQIGAIVDEVELKMRGAGLKPVAREGERDGRWVLLDFVEIVVHVQHAEERVFYALDRLWKDCPTEHFTDGDAGGHPLARSEPAMVRPEEDDSVEGDEGPDGDDEDLRL
jgi:ribosome-associated protein